MEICDQEGDIITLGKRDVSLDFLLMLFPVQVSVKSIPLILLVGSTLMGFLLRIKKLSALCVKNLVNL